MKLKGTESRLWKLDETRSEECHEQIIDMLERGVARKLTRREVDHWEGPLHYLSHHDIIRPDSVSTPIQIVFFVCHVLNNYWAKGSNVLNSLFGLLLRFRENPSAFVGDISKILIAYVYLNLTVKYIDSYGETLKIVPLIIMSSLLFLLGTFVVPQLLC